jgi:hypothetical protein
MTQAPLQYFTKDHAVSMTLRDYFAAKAMQALLNSDEWRENLDVDKEIPPSAFTADAAYHMADAMMKAREA